MNVSKRTTLANSAGFSLVELMVVVAIIGILAAIAVPQYQRFSAKAKQGEAKANLSALYSAERAFFAEWQTFATGFNTIGYRPGGTLRYDHGWAANFPAAFPLGYTGPQDAANFSAGIFCGLGAVGANGCGVVNTPIAPGAIAGSGMAVATFTAEARGHIGNAAASAVDVWLMTQNKVLTNPNDGLP